jgi:predicted dienelactone hydrolase
LSLIIPYCAEYPDRVCGMLKERNVDTSTPASAWVHDGRIKAAVVAAPTLGFTFGKDVLAPIKAAHTALARRERRNHPPSAAC